MASKFRNVLVRALLGLAGLVLLLGGGAAIGYYWLPNLFPRQQESAPCEETTDRIPATGRLEPKDGFIDIHGPTGDRIQAIEVKLDEWVGPDNVLAKLESYRDREGELAYAVTQRDQATAQRKAIDEQAKAQRAEACLRREELARMDQLDLDAQAAKLEAIQIQLNKADADFKEMKDLNSRSTGTGGISKQELDNQRVLVERTTKEKDAANALLNKLELAKKYNQQAADAQEITAQKTLERLKGEVPLASLEKNVQLAKDRLERSKIMARVKGQVMEILAQPGDTVGPQPIFRLADTSQMIVIAEVDERNIDKLREWYAQKNVRVKITGRAFGDKEFTGQIDRINDMVAKSPIPEIDPKKEADRRVFEVWITPDDDFKVVAQRFVNLPVTVDFYPEKKGPDR